MASITKKKLVANAISSSSGGSGGNTATLYEAEVLIPTAEVLTLNSIPVTIVTAPGAGKFIEVVSATGVVETYGGIPYDTNVVLQLIHAGANVRQFYDGGSTLLSTVPKNVVFQNSLGVTATQTQIVTNADLLVQIQTGNPTLGNSDIKVKILYRIVTI